jgi:hypothetical protein
MVGKTQYMTFLYESAFLHVGRLLDKQRQIHIQKTRMIYFLLSSLSLFVDREKNWLDKEQNLPIDKQNDTCLFED